MQPLNLVRASDWEHVLFTTYALSLSFFEAVIMDALVRGGGRDPVILADTEGVRYALSERGARLVGREYNLQPVERDGGVFHPKVAAFIKGDDAHLLIGSGNLTFGGWGGNLEFINHLHGDFAPEAILDAADFLESLVLDDKTRMADTTRLETTADMLRNSVRDKRGKGRCRLVYNANETIAARLSAAAGELGGAERICVVSPFFDRTARGIVALADDLGCEEVNLYVHPGFAVRGRAGCNWPDVENDRLKPVQIDETLSIDARMLHAKGIEILCRKGRLILSGSPNASQPALYGANVEVGLLRIEPDRDGAWSFVSCESPVAYVDTELEDDAEDDNRCAILTAELRGFSIEGQVLTSWDHASASLECEIGDRILRLGDIPIGADGAFSLRAEEVAEEAWQAPRIVMRLRAGDAIAEGFLSVEAIAAIARRAGAAGPRILSILAGTETPEDVAIIISWFQEDPSRIPRLGNPSSGSTNAPSEAPDAFVTPEMLKASVVSERDENTEHHSEFAYRSAMKALLKAFRTSRGPFDEESQATKEQGELEEFEASDLASSEKYTEETIDSFSILLEAALDGANDGRYAETMLALTHYLVDRLRPPEEKVWSWLAQIGRSLPDTLEGDFAADVVALQLMRTANSPHDFTPIAARRLLRSRGLLSLISEAQVDRLPAIQSYLPPVIPIAEAQIKLLAVRTHREELEQLLSTAADEDLPPLPLLEQSKHWRKLQQLHGDSRGREQLEYAESGESACPGCNRVLPTGHAQELLQTGLTRCPNKCGRFIIARDG